MGRGARRYSKVGVRCALPAMLVCLCLGASPRSAAQLGPIDHDGFVEYQYRHSRAEGGASARSNLAGWYARASTWVWRPYILQLDGTLGLAENRDVSSASNNRNSIVTGSLAASVFSRSRFPFRAFIDARDSRIDASAVETDLAIQNWGFMQQYSPVGGGRISLDYRASSSEEIHVDGFTSRRKFGSEQWQFIGNKNTRSNDFRLLAVSRDLARERPDQSLRRNFINFRHRFKPGSTFFIEDTTFLSDERVRLNGLPSDQRLLQFNALSTWRPRMEKSLIVNARAFARRTDVERDDLQHGATSFVMTSSVNYQLSPAWILAGNAGFSNMDPDMQEEVNTTNQRIRLTYRPRGLALGQFLYAPGASVEAGNLSTDGEESTSTQDVAARLNHGLSRTIGFRGGSQIQISVNQSLAALTATDDREEQSLVHTAFATWSRQQGRAYNLIQLTGSDRRMYGDRRDVYQLVSLLASSRMQINRRRALNGGVSLQYSDQSVLMTNDQMMDNSSVGYSVNLSYSHQDLFKVRNLRLRSDLRLLSREFDEGDSIEEKLTARGEQSDRVWRNELTYRIGLLEFRLIVDLRDINRRWSRQAFFGVRRYYGTRGFLG